MTTLDPDLWRRWTCGLLSEREAVQRQEWREDRRRAPREGSRIVRPEMPKERST